MTLNKNYLILLLVMLLVIFCRNIQAYSAFLSNGFIVTSQYRQFNNQSTECHGKICHSKICHGEIFFPKLINDNSLAVTNINAHIGNFMQHYQINCNTKKYRLQYDVRTGSKEVFTVKWQTKTYDDHDNESLIKIETLNFNIADGNLLTATDILSPLAKNFMPEIVKLSKNHLEADASWSLHQNSKFLI
jgi:hypothetical protein